MAKGQQGAKTKKALRAQVQRELSAITARVNQYLKGESLDEIQSFVAQLEPRGVAPSWLQELGKFRRPKKTDPKSLGTMIEKLLKAEMSRRLNIKITGSSARGVDIPELDLNTKATSDRQPQSSEPFISCYERILGARFDIVVCVYNGKEFHGSPASPLRIIYFEYLKKTQVADKRLCEIAKKLQDRLRAPQPLDVSLGRRVLRCLAYAQKGKRRLLRDLEKALQQGDREAIEKAVGACEESIESYVGPSEGIPTEAEWKEFLRAPLDGKIGISFALQWRYQFTPLVKPTK